MIDLRHELVKLAALIDLEGFDREWVGFFPSSTGLPATAPQLMAGLLDLQHAYPLSDEAARCRQTDANSSQFFGQRQSVRPSEDRATLRERQHGSA
jgi:IS5 family transposase